MTPQPFYIAVQSPKEALETYRKKQKEKYAAIYKPINEAIYANPNSVSYIVDVTAPSKEHDATVLDLETLAKELQRVGWRRAYVETTFTGNGKTPTHFFYLVR